ncbi:GtrA family protein [Leucobacter luti]|uniref:GtrA family protein n=1 Tax=Leucobacter luti TaxID=340320 RepID=UPI001404E024|nr:GtrA family protein [Leucobacter luti]MCW2289838.1 putative flippase GtrA [Leucobacter luti]
MSLIRRVLGDGSILRYALVGIGMSVLDLALFTLCSVVLGANEIIANVVSTILTVCVSYLINRRWVFRADRASWRSFVSFAGVTLVTGLIVQTSVIWAIVHLAPLILPELTPAILLPAAKITAMGVGALMNFIGYRFVFRKRER